MEKRKTSRAMGDPFSDPFSFFVDGGEFRLLALRGFIGIGAKRSDVHESGDPVIGSCGRDDTSTVRVIDDRRGWQGC
jgi:hypothetical protein